MFHTVVVKRGARTAHLKDGRLERLYGPGRHTVWTFGGLHEFIEIDTGFPIQPVPAGGPLPDDLEGARIISVDAHERVVVLLHGQFVQVLERGRWRWWDAHGEPTLLRLDRRAPPVLATESDPLPANTPGATVTGYIEPGLLQYAGRPHSLVPAGRWRVWDADAWRIAAIPRGFNAAPVDRGERIDGEVELQVGEHERAVVLRNGAFLQVLDGGRYIGWEAAGPYTVLRFDCLAEPTPLGPDDPLPAGTHGTDWTEASGHDALAVVLVRDGQPWRVLPEGRYRAWTGSRWSLKGVPLSLQALDVAAQDLLTADEVPLRVKPAVTVRVVDPVTVLRQPDWPNQVYVTVQLALREVVSSRTLEALLAERESLGEAIIARARATLPAIGLALELAAVKDIILSGEIKDLLNRVTLARKEAEALSIKRREETAATRQLANTARMLENNPVLLRLKELEALGDIASRIDRITVVGSGGELMKTVLLSDLAKTD